MGQTTANLQIWTPDEADLDEPDVYLAAMSASIENGTGERLKLQEIAVGLKAGISTAFGIDNAQKIVPFSVGASNAEFNQGLTFDGGIVTVQTPGMYLVSAALGVNPDATYAGTSSGVIWLYKNSTIVTYGETPISATYTVSTQCTAVVNCVAGDTIKVQGSTGGGTTTGVTLNNAGYPTYLSIAMVQAVPQ
ncbi:hypothetical protein [uncultured Arthrobacter sp.]|uniref:hypothetical protein n=1 Tax=uncultured Arthrobacter sp. TaxID=114050 RepID=UPI0032176CB5